MQSPLPPELSMIKDFICQCIPFDELTDEDILQSAKQIEVRYFKKGHVFNIDDEQGGLRIIRSGAVELRNNQQDLLDRFGEGHSFNLLGLNREQPGIRATLIEDTLIYHLPENTYQRLRQSHRDFDRFFTSQRSRRVRRAARHDPNPNEMMRPISHLMSAHLHVINLHSSIQECAARMSELRISSMLVMQDGELLGIITDRDIRSRAVAKGLPLSEPAHHIMTANPKTIDHEQTIFDATLLMTQQGIHHLPVKKDGQVIGIITASDLMLAKQDDPVFVVQHIGRQTDLAAIENITQQLPNLLVQWVAAGIRAHQVSKIFTAISDAVTVRIIELVQQQMGPAPCEFCWLGFGSQGRAEQLLGADQDNGIILSPTATESDKEWFKTFAGKVCDGLNTCGYVYCKGKVMASTDAWRQPIQGWQKTVDRWTQSPSDDAVMRVSIFFDLRCIYGQAELCETLQQYMLKKTSQNSIFLAALAQNVLSTSPPLGIFRQFVVEHNGEHADHLDLKKRGIIPIIDMVRLHALANKVTAVNTQQRLADLAKYKAMSLLDSRNLDDALRVIMQIRIQNQAQQIEQGLPANNYLDPEKMSKLVRKQLKDAFSVVKDAQQSVKLRYRQGLA